MTRFVVMCVSCAMCLGVCVFGLTGCGGGGSGSGSGGGKGPAVDPVQQTAEDAVEDWEEDGEGPEDAEGARSDADSDTDSEADAEPKERVLPDNFADWTREDYLHAKATKFDRLEDAITTLAFVPQNRRGEAAETLALLIPRPVLVIRTAEDVAAEEAESAGDTEAAETSEAAETPEDAEEEDPDEDPDTEEPDTQPEAEPEPPLNPSELPELELVQLSQQQLKAALETLFALDCPEAHAVLERVVRREIETDDDKAAVEQILAGYAALAAEGPLARERETFLLRVMTVPMLVRPAPEKPAGTGTEPGQENQPGQAPSRFRGQDVVEIAPGELVRVAYVGGNSGGRQTDMEPLEMQARVFEKFRGSASPWFRAELAKFFLNRKDSVVGAIPAEYMTNERLQQSATRMLEYLMEKRVENVEAQVLFYRSGQTSVEQRDKIEENLLACYLNLLRIHLGTLDAKTLTEYAEAKALRDAESARREAAARQQEQEAGNAQEEAGSGSLLATLSRDRAAGGGTAGDVHSRKNYSDAVRMLLDVENTARIRELLWSDDMRKVLGKRIKAAFEPFLELAQDPESAANPNQRGAQIRLEQKDTRAVQMYVSIPSNAVRKSLYRVLRQGWAAGPAVFEQALFGKLELDPGFLMVVKSQDRSVRPEKKDRARTSKEGSKAPKKPASPAALKRELEQEVAGAWMDEAYRLAADWCVKLAEPVQVPGQDEAPDTSDLEDGELPDPGAVKLDKALAERFPFPQGAEVLSYREIRDPQTGAEPEKGALRVRFFEVECESLPAKLIAGLRGQNPGLLERGEFGTPGQGGGRGRGARQNLAGTWLERFALDEASGLRESLDIILVPETYPEQPQNREQDGERKTRPKRATVQKFRVYVLLMEMENLREEAPAKQRSGG